MHFIQVQEAFMRIIVFSDTHGNMNVIDKIIADNQFSNHFMFLGDGLKELEIVRLKYPDKKFYAVLGNCDKGDAPEEQVVTIGGARIYMAHGHLLGVKESLDELKERARENKADAALFGHTHERYFEYEGGMFVLNPGSASQPADDLPPSYAFIDIGLTGVGGTHIDIL